MYKNHLQVAIYVSCIVTSSLVIASNPATKTADAAPTVRLLVPPAPEVVRSLWRTTPLQGTIDQHIAISPIGKEDKEKIDAFVAHIKKAKAIDAQFIDLIKSNAKSEEEKKLLLSFHYAHSKLPLSLTLGYSESSDAAKKCEIEARSIVASSLGGMSEDSLKNADARLYKLCDSLKFSFASAFNELGESYDKIESSPTALDLVQKVMESLQIKSYADLFENC